MSHMYIMPYEIAVVNRSTLADTAVRRVVRAVQRQVERDFVPAWGLAARLRLEPRVPRNTMLIVVRDEPDPTTDAVGYHFQETSGMPVAYVFARDAVEMDGSIGPTLSHEALEMLADPAVNLAAERPARGGRPHRFYAYEVCDPVQADLYRIDGEWVSNFVFPEWFETIWKRDGHPFDQLKKVHLPFEIRAGGYCDVKDRDGWRELAVGARRRGKRHRLSVRRGARFVRPLPR
jgi:hypothetical protein